MASARCQHGCDSRTARLRSVACSSQDTATAQWRETVSDPPLGQTPGGHRLNPSFREVIAASDAERCDLFLGTAARLGTVVQNVEKDF